MEFNSAFKGLMMLVLIQTIEAFPWHTQ